ncbi:MAG TPA: sigma-70 family RNA polymerase sigma factor [Patescibacteria group bacterium]|nr:sigma-70 family RNA polymerase sigma factor [Patescibacteria group bacterium]
MPDKTDEQLVGDYLAGDSTALRFLVERYLPKIYHFIYRYVGNATDAEDLTQEVFIRVWKNLKKFDPTKKFKTWLFTIAKNISFDWLKKKKNLNFSDLINSEGDNPLVDNILDPAPLPDELLARADIVIELNAALSQLPARYSQVLELYYHEEFNLREIAEILEVPVDTIKSRHRRALIMLRPLLK